MPPPIDSLGSLSTLPAVARREIFNSDGDESCVVPRGWTLLDLRGHGLACVVMPGEEAAETEPLEDNANVSVARAFSWRGTKSIDRDFRDNEVFRGRARRFSSTGSLCRLESGFVGCQLVSKVFFSQCSSRVVQIIGLCVIFIALLYC